MTNKWTKGDLAALDQLLGKYPLTEIVAKANRRTRRKAGRPAYDQEIYGASVFCAIELRRFVGHSIPVAANDVARYVSTQWEKPVTAKSLMRIHREYCRKLGVEPKDATKLYAAEINEASPTESSETTVSVMKLIGLSASPIEPSLYPSLKERVRRRKMKPKNSG